MHHSLKKRPKISHKTRGALLQELAQTTSKSGSGWVKCTAIVHLIWALGHKVWGDIMERSNEVFLQTACLVFSHLFIQYLLCCWSSIEREKHSPCPFQVLTQPGTWIKRRLWVEFDEKYVLAVQFQRRYLPGASVGGIVFVFSIVKTSVVVVVGVVVVVVVGFVLLESIAT